MTQGKAGGKCATAGCAKVPYRSGFCDSCYRRELRGSQPARVIRSACYATGEVRRLDGVNERQMTDGSMTWWVTKT